MQSIQSALSAATLQLAASSATAKLDAEVLLCHTLSKNRSYLRAWFDTVIDEKQAVEFWRLINARYHGTPIAYLTGRREFWSRDFYVTPDVLIPRPETELLIELCLDLLPKSTTASILDLGTGSGIIAITLAAERPHAQISACDNSLAALDIAKQNTQSHHVNVAFYHSVWFDTIPDGTFDLIVSNPPYIATTDRHLQQGDLRFEPKTALCAAYQGLSDIRLIAEGARQRLASGGHLLIEHGYDQERAVQSIFNDYHYNNITTYRDLSGQPRVTYGLWHD